MAVFFTDESSVELVLTKTRQKENLKAKSFGSHRLMAWFSSARWSTGTPWPASTSPRSLWWPSTCMGWTPGPPRTAAYWWPSPSPRWQSKGTPLLPWQRENCAPLCFTLKKPLHLDISTIDIPPPPPPLWASVVIFYFNWILYVAIKHTLFCWFGYTVACYICVILISLLLFFYNITMCKITSHNMYSMTWFRHVVEPQTNVFYNSSNNSNWNDQAGYLKWND